MEVEKKAKIRRGDVEDIFRSEDNNPTDDTNVKKPGDKRKMNASRKKRKGLVKRQASGKNLSKTNRSGSEKDKNKTKAKAKAKSKDDAEYFSSPSSPSDLEDTSDSDIGSDSDSDELTTSPGDSDSQSKNKNKSKSGTKKDSKRSSAAKDSNKVEKKDLDDLAQKLEQLKTHISSLSDTQQRDNQIRSEKSEQSDRERSNERKPDDSCGGNEDNDNGYQNSKEPDKENKGDQRSAAKEKKKMIGSTIGYKRVDHVWKKTEYKFSLQESVEEDLREFDYYGFLLRRSFDIDQDLLGTLVDVKSPILRDALREILKGVVSVSLEADYPSILSQNMFQHLPNIKSFTEKTLQARLHHAKQHKERERIRRTIAHCRSLVECLNEEFKDTKNQLYPMLKAGKITFDLIWALFKPGRLVYTPTFGSTRHARSFIVDYTSPKKNRLDGEWYEIEGRFLNFDGYCFGYSDFSVNIEKFEGPRRIDSLACYPLKFHKDHKTLRKELLKRGKNFVTLGAAAYRHHKGHAFSRKYGRSTDTIEIEELNVEGRVMLDSAGFQRENPRYPSSRFRPKTDWIGNPESDSEEDDESDNSSGEDSDGSAGIDADLGEKPRLILFKDKECHYHLTMVKVGPDEDIIDNEEFKKLVKLKDPDSKAMELTEEDLISASPVAQGFSFSEKKWLEFTVSGIKDLEWNTGAFSSLELPEAQKSLIKSLVEAHKSEQSKTIDDVVQGKGKGLIALLHGPTGVGKTLTAEGVAEHLRVPCYAIAAGELGTGLSDLEPKLQRILDTAHSWGAVLLLDEADVYLERREDYAGRTTIVSTFLRVLEYFRGVLFLTTNRVHQFDEAVQSRIHIALKYEKLETPGKMAVWKTFLDKVAKTGCECEEWTEENYTALAAKDMNGRQIKNAVRSAQALAISKQEKLSMDHIRQVIKNQEDFMTDLEGGIGFKEAMKSLFN